jgi:histidyl-tRNA synthetase
VTRFEAPRGTHDILPSEQPLWQWVTAQMEEVCSLYGYRRVDTPGIEDTELIVRTSGGGSDVVQKETYTFEDRGGRSLTLRPEATAPICRAYVQHGMHREPQPQKLYTTGPMWRYDRPQKGRYREHWQLSVEAIGTDDPAIDAEVIQLYADLLRRLGVTEYTLELNSIGDRNCRPAYVERLAAWLDEHDAELDDEARSKRATTPLRVFDVKSDRVQAVLAGAPKIGESLCDECREHFARVRAFLDAYGVAYELQPTLVRGLDYYTRTTFEFKDEAIGAKDTICGGGRYDGLIEEIGGPATPGIGFGMGIERLLLAADAEGVFPGPASAVDVWVVDTTGGAAAVALTHELRAAGISADRSFDGRSMKSQFKSADRSGARLALVVGNDELAAATVTLRDLRGGEQETVGRADVVEHVSLSLSNMQELS